MLDKQPVSIFSYLINGFQLIWQPCIRPYALIPIVINFILFIGFYVLAITYFQDFTHWFDNHLPHWLQWLSHVLWLIFAIAILFTTAYSFTFISNLIAAPFNGLLAEQVELHITGRLTTPPTNFLATIKDVPRSLSRQLRYITYVLPRALGILFLLLIPGGQLIMGPLWFIFNAWLMALQYLDYPMDNHRVNFSDMKKQLWQQPITSLTFGLSVAVLTTIPLVNLFVMPAATAGATQLWLERFKNIPK